MINWDLYQKRLNINGDTQRERTINLVKGSITKTAIHSPDYKNMVIDGTPQSIMVSSTEVDNKKRIKSMPGETIKLGALIVWNGMHWLVNSVDFDDEIYQSGTIVQCNRMIRWQNPITLEIIERWCFCSKPYTSNTKQGLVVSTLNGRYDIQLPYDNETVQVGVGKRLILDVVGGTPMVYEISFPDTNTNVFQDVEGGFIEWAVESVEYVPERDNVELMICDYIKPDSPPPSPDPPIEDLFKCEITGRSDIRIGGIPRKYVAKFFTADGSETIENISPIWELITPPGHEDFYNILLSEQNFVVNISAEQNDELFGDTIVLKLSSNDEKYKSVEMRIEVIG